jgi:hypothetical protein
MANLPAPAVERIEALRAGTIAVVVNVPNAQ